MSELIIKTEDKTMIMTDELNKSSYFAKMEDGKQAVEYFLREEKLEYSLQDAANGDCCYQVEMGEESLGFPMKITLVQESKKCFVTACLPVKAEAAYEYPLCLYLAKVNKNADFGGFRYDDESGEITFEYAFFWTTGIESDELAEYFFAAFNSVSQAYAHISRYCRGGFTADELKEIGEKCSGLTETVRA